MLIGIAGPSASGKTTLAKELYNKFNSSGISCAIVSMDDYFLDCSHMNAEEIKERNFDHPDAIEFPLLKKHLGQLLAGEEIPKLHYQHRLAKRECNGEKIKPADVIILEGLYALYEPELIEKMNLKIFVDTDLETCLKRRIRRSQLEPERKEPPERVVERYRKHVEPMYKQYIEPTKYCADLVVVGE